MPVAAPLAAVAASGHLDTRTAATEVADALFDDLASSACDLLLVFGSYHHRSAFDEAAAIIRRTISPETTLGVTTEGVIGDEQELEGFAGLSAIALRLPGARVTPWSSSRGDALPLRDPQRLRERLGLSNHRHDAKAALLLGDPFTTPITKLLPAIANIADAAIVPNEGDRQESSVRLNKPSSTNDALGGASAAGLPVIGGMASGASQPGLNVMVLNDRILTEGAVGATLAGDFEIDFAVSHGARPIGPPLVITKARGNIIIELNGRKALEALHEIAQGLGESDRRALSRGLLVGHVVNEYRPHFGRGDFVIRNVLGFDQRAGGIAAGEMTRVGRTVQFHVRDAAAATQDLQMLLDGQMLHEQPPFAGLLFTCGSRGERFFGEANHDVHLIRQRFGGDVPIAGFFAAGEFGPLGNRSYLHGHTASLALFRAPPSA